MFTIYALVHPETHQIRYVGKTMFNARRLQSHIKAARRPRTHCQKWVSSLLKQGLKPGWVVCDTCDDEATANRLEKAWIKLFRMADIPLTNHTDGGEGVVGLVCSEETRAKHVAIHTGKLRGPQSAEERAKKSAALVGKRHSAEYKAKTSAALTGKHPSAETRAKMSAAHKGKAHSAEHKAKRSIANKAAWARKKAATRGTDSAPSPIP